MKWNLRWAAARRDIWRPSDLLTAFEDVGFTPSLSKVAALWSGKPISVRLDDLDKICAALGCTVADQLEPEPDRRCCVILALISIRYRTACSGRLPP
jgi:DNA-binding Xre family transcriptional regulator